MFMFGKNTVYWLAWVALTGGLVAFFLLRLFAENPEEDKTVFLPGHTSDGHYQIELACNACHTGPYADRDAMQQACEGCHGAALKEAKDDHPKSKFTDPRNADRIAVLDARYCVTCHVEHRPEITGAMGVTVPADVCYLCHADIAEDRPSHEGMAFDTCASAGCHNFHDNRALYEDFLVKHMDEAATDIEGRLLQANLRDIVEQLPDYPLDQHPLNPVDLAAQQWPAEVTVSEEITADWLASGHAASGVGCNGCHVATEDGEWLESPSHEVCASCHRGETDGFLAGRHGMRLDVEKIGQTLPAMQPASARLPMKSTAGAELSCQSCHGAHRYDTVAAPVEACLSCHDDEHSKAYEQSPHAALWLAEQQGEAEAGSGVSCASCHMPRFDRDYFWGTFTHNQVQHNQSANLRPNEKMIREVCLNCHGLPFTLDALADPQLIQNNFSTPPTVHVDSVDLARERAAPGT